MKYGFVVVLLIGAALSGCTKITTPPAGMDVTRQEPPQQEFYGATITFYQGDKTNGVLQAGRIRKFEKSAQIFLDSGVVMDFYNEQGQHTTKLWADSARTDEGRKDMVAMGHVIAKSDSGETLLTEVLRWDNRNRQIRSDVPVKLMTRTDTINGIGFVSDEHLRSWHVMSPTGLTFRELQKPTPGTAGGPVTPPDSLLRSAVPARPETLIPHPGDTLR